MLERAVELNLTSARLVGTACLPGAAGRFPTVLMIHGSGPLDRDENIAGQRLDVFNTVAHHLAAVGVASVRYDKRGCGKSSGDYYSAGHHELVSDALGWVDALQDHDFCDPSSVFLLGHSEGCIIAPQVILERPRVAGLILLCPFIENLKDVLTRQAAHVEEVVNEAQGMGAALQRGLIRLFGSPLANQRALVSKIEASSEDVIRHGLQRLPAKWFREMFALNPPEIFARLDCPMLLIGGEKDVQCLPGDVQKILETVRGEAEGHVVPNLTHVLRTEVGKPSLLRTAQLLKDPMNPAVLSIIAGWIQKRLRA